MARVEAGERTALTVGEMRVEPGAHNIIPGLAVFPVELRDVDGPFLESFEPRLRGHLDRAGLPYRLELIAHKLPVPMSPEVQEAIRQSAQELGLRYQTMPSGAGHDAMSMARLTPTGMIFVPSRGGFSHCPEEHTDWDQAAQGADLLLATLLRLDSAEGAER
jgi:acetylornithine deacetylase/succinyl-diaminopimelate desuccinylase-like protein